VCAATQPSSRPIAAAQHVEALPAALQDALLRPGLPGVLISLPAGFRERLGSGLAGEVARGKGAGGAAAGAAASSATSAGVLARAYSSTAAAQQSGAASTAGAAAAAAAAAYASASARPSEAATGTLPAQALPTPAAATAASAGPTLASQAAAPARRQRRLRPRSKPGTSCAACGATPDDVGRFKMCAGCDTARYCNHSCQKTHWLQHKQAGCPGRAKAAGPAAAGRQQQQDGAALQ
jgi:hypothetical protein